MGTHKPRRVRSDVAKSTSKRAWPVAAAMVGGAVGTLAIALAYLWPSPLPPKPLGRVIVLPNGGGAALVELENRRWQVQLHDTYPHARRIGLWSANGTELVWSELDGRSGGSYARLARYNLSVYAVVDEFPFVWPASVEQVELGDARPVALRLLSERPRVLIADEVFTAIECDAVRRLALPKMSESTQIVGGVQSVAATARNSDTAWMPKVDRATAAGGGDEAVLATVQVQ